MAREAGCQVPFGFSKPDLAKRFLDFANAPDQLVPGIDYDNMPCPKSKKASKRCRERNGESNEEKRPTKTENNNQPSPTSHNTFTSQANIQSSGSQPSTHSATPSSSSANARTTADCAAIGRDDLEALLEDFKSDEIIEEKRDARVSIHSRRLQARGYNRKSGDVCKVTLTSGRYPTAGDKFMVC